MLEKITMSSNYTTATFYMTVYIITPSTRWNVAGACFNPKKMETNYQVEDDWWPPFFRVFSINLYLPISIVGMKTGEEGQISRLINAPAHSWHWVIVPYNHQVYSVIVDPKPQTAVFLWSKHNQTGLHRCFHLNTFFMEHMVDLYSCKLSFCSFCLVRSSVHRAVIIAH